MNDEDYWNVTRQSRFDTDLDDNVIQSSPFRETKQTQSLDKLYSYGLSDCLEEANKLQKYDDSSYNYSFDVKNETSQGGILQRISKSNYITVDSLPQNTVKKLFLNLDCIISQHKKLNEKLALLDFALKTHDGDVILTVILFLKNTLTKSLFFLELQKRPEAMSQYMYFLEKDGELNELSDLLMMTGDTEDSALLKYESAIRVNDPESKLKKLGSCISTHFQPPMVSSFLADSATEQLHHLEHQILIKEHFSSPEFNASILMESVISTLYYCCTHHYLLGENSYASPLAIKTRFKLSDKQYVWTAITALAELKNWLEIENLFINKSWLGNTKMRCCIGFNKVVPLLANAGAPPKLIQRYIELVDDNEEQLSLAKKYKYHEMIMQILKNIKDKQEYLIYQSTLSPQSVEFIEIEEVLHSPNIKWKN